MSDTLVREMLLDADLPVDETDELVGFLTSLRGSAGSEQPVPDARLLALFASSASAEGSTDHALDAHSDDERVVRLRRRDGRIASAAAAVAISTVAATGVAAAANELPAPAQLVVSHFSQHFLPFEFPTPPPASQSPADKLSGEPAVPTPALTRQPVPVQDQPALDPVRPQGLSEQVAPSLSAQPNLTPVTPTAPEATATGSPSPSVDASGTASASPSGSSTTDPSGDATSSPSGSPSAESPASSPTGTPPVVRGSDSASPSPTDQATLTTEDPSPTG